MRLIDADALMELANSRFSKSVDANDIARFPVLEAEPVVHGHWLDDGDCGWMCSECGHNTWEMIGECTQSESGVVWIEKTPYFCPKCGANMEGK